MFQNALIDRLAGIGVTRIPGVLLAWHWVPGTGRGMLVEFRRVQRQFQQWENVMPILRRLISFCCLSVLFMVAGLQPLFAEPRSVNDQFMTLGEVNTDHADQLQSKAGPAYVGTWDIELDPGVFNTPPPW